jgi:hypothetical protein
MGLSNGGKDIVAHQIGDTAGASGTSTAASATSLTDSGASFPASSGGPPARGGLVGHIVVAGSVYGVILSNTGTVLTVDMWHSATAPDTVGSTPGATSAYIVLPGNAPAYFTGISVATRAFNAADDFLSNDGSTISELWFSGGGLKRKLATWAHTDGTGTFTLTTTWTANGSDTLPQAIAKWACFQHEVTAAPTTTTTGRMLFNTLLSALATLAASGDNVTVTNTVTES